MRAIGQVCALSYLPKKQPDLLWPGPDPMTENARLSRLCTHINSEVSSCPKSVRRSQMPLTRQGKLFCIMLVVQVFQQSTPEKP